MIRDRDQDVIGRQLNVLLNGITGLNRGRER